MNRKHLAAVVIGRNEGARLARCFASLNGQCDELVYVDSGSTDDSLNIARKAAARIVELDMSKPFTAARARNAGIAKVGDADFVQIVDGDCEVLPEWTVVASDFLVRHPDVAAVAGRLQERHPEATIWNRLAQAEWDAPTGETTACGGIALLRLDAFLEAGGFREDLIAGEEPELCLRLRRNGYKIWRLDKDMALHDIAMTRFGQWWTRTRRGGHAFAAGAALHGGGAERYRRREVSRALLWGVYLPVLFLLGLIFASPLALGVLLAYPAQVLRLRFLKDESWSRSFFLVLGKFAEAQGILSFVWRRFTGAQNKLGEYDKSP